MHPIKTIKDFLKSKITDPFVDFNVNSDKALWTSLGSSTYNYYKSNDMENGYASIRVIVNNFAKIQPYTINGKGTAVASNIIDRIYTPNTAMSAYEFREALAVMSLVHNKVRIKVHSKVDGQIRAENITGFTFLENAVESIVEGKRQYRLMNGETLDDTNVITLLNINPYDIDEGFSQAQGAKKWTTLDDYIADYQKGFFENGAVPSGQLIITAKTKKDFDDTVTMLKHRHQGASKSGNITFTHRPLDESGKPSLGAGIEWQPFAVANKDLALKDLFETVNKKIDSAYGVPASLRGVNDTNTYASIKADQRILIENVIEPLVLKIWGKFTHELNRICLGTGVAVLADVEIPNIADEELVEAQTKEVEKTIIVEMVQAGYDLPSIVDAFDLPSRYKKLGKKVAIDVEDKPEIVDSADIKDTPDQPIDAFSKAFEPKDRIDYENKLSAVVRTRMQAQIDNVIEHYEPMSKAPTFEEPIEPQEDALLAKQMLAVLMACLIAQGKIEHIANTELAVASGITIENLAPFKMSTEQFKAYTARINKIAQSYNAETAQEIRNVVANGVEQQLTAQEIKTQLKDLMEQDEYRINRVAVTEVNKAGTDASLFSMQNIAEETGTKWNKVWTHAGGDAPCEYCASLQGTSVGLDEPYVDLDHHVTGADGGEFINSFEPIDSGGLHPHCHCLSTYERVK